METFDTASYIVKSTLYIVVALLALIYSLPILCIRRFQHRNNVCTVNVCLTVAFYCLSATPDCLRPLLGYSSVGILKRLPWLFVLHSLSDTAIPYSLVLVSFHRCCSIVYAQKRFFRTRRWTVVCFVVQWIVTALLSLPTLLFSNRVSGVLRRQASHTVSNLFQDSKIVWPSMCIPFTVLILPASIGTVTNTLIYWQVRASSSRVQVAAVANESTQTRITRRDIFLLRHMVIMLSLFIIGWAPWVILEIVGRFTSVNRFLSLASYFSFQLVLLLDVIDLFLYNHEVRKYLIQRCLSCCRR